MKPNFTTTSNTQTGLKKFNIYLFQEEEYNEAEGNEMIEEVSYFMGNSVDIDRKTSKLNLNDQEWILEIGIKPTQLESILKNEDYIIITTEYL